jgi:hypothetical protein
MPAAAENFTASSWGSKKDATLNPRLNHASMDENAVYMHDSDFEDD